MTRELEYQLIAVIQRERENAKRSIDQLRDALLSLEYGTTRGESGRILGERGVLVEAIVQAHERMEKIDAALDRAQSRRFGFCLDCEGEIQERRLRAQPWSERCVSCQQQIEMSLLRASPAEMHANASHA